MVTGTQVLGGRYVLGKVLGTGGMATVWQATDEVLGREVAVKVLSPQFAADAGFMARFEREARHAARLSHPRLVTVFDSGIDNGTAFIVMELVAGRTLRQVLDDVGILPPGQAVGIAVGVCEALEVAHAAGLVHRDIKPANILVSGGEVKVVDFGIARADDSAGGSRTLVLGTAAYLSPEQASGRPAGPQSDLYSLGCVLFEMLTGSPPFTADSAVGLAYQHVHDDPDPPSVRRPGVPAQLDKITAQLLAKDPAARPLSAAAARAGLLAALIPDAMAVLTTPGDDAGLPAPGGRGHRRPTRIEILLAVALAAVLVVLAVVLLTGTTGHAAPRTAPSVTPSSTTGHAAHTAPSSTPSATPHSPATHPAAPQTHKPARKRPTARHTSALPPVAAAAATFVGDLEAGVADGQVTPQAGQDLYSHLQPLLFGPPDQDPQHVQEQYAQLVQSYDQHRSQGQITGHAAIVLHGALRVLGAAVGAG
jgi:eukaryotic-like serine/threonine-protein kinase